jgi:cystathionine gamma-synthase
MRIVDVADICRRARAVGARSVVDNTFLSPALQTPIALGADVVVHSTTKFVNGHSDVVGGAVISADAEVHAETAWWANATGVTGAPFDAWLTLRGLRTLFVRVERQQASALEIARRLERAPGVKAVHHPGLESHPGHALAARQQKGFGSMLSVELEGGIEAVRAFVEPLGVFTLAESLGGVESLVAHPALMTHLAMTPEARRTAGIGDGLIRLSVGLEHLADLWADLERGLGAVAALNLAEAA